MFLAPDHSGNTRSTSPSFNGPVITCSGNNAIPIPRRGQDHQRRRSIFLLGLVKVEKSFVHFLYRNPAFDAFDDFNDFVESVSCETSKTCQVPPVVRIHAGEPPLGINAL
jgi:hypothetical protein